MRQFNHLGRFTLIAAVAITAAIALPAIAMAADAEGDVGFDLSGGRPDIPKESVWLSAESDQDRPFESESKAASSNTLPFVGFEDGDLVIAMESLSVGHAGEWDARYYSNVKSQCVWSAVKSSPGCVLREAPLKYRTYDKAYGLWVPSLSASARAACRAYCAAQAGEPYLITSSKSDQSKWYCSKLVWASYWYRAGKDLDANGGYWVTPVDLYKDNDTRVFAAAN
jgi:hypothetical protein